MTMKLKSITRKIQEYEKNNLPPNNSSHGVFLASGIRELFHSTV